MTKSEEDHMTNLSQRVVEIVNGRAEGIRADELLETLLNEEKDRKKASNAIRIALDDHTIALGPKMLLIAKSKAA